jgi:hypothetical protein
MPCSDFPKLQQFIDIARIRQEQLNSVKIQSRSLETTRNAMQVVTPGEVTSQISEIVKLVQDAHSDQFIVSTLHLCVMVYTLTMLSTVETNSNWPC